MISRKFEEVENLIKKTDERWSDKAYVASLRLKTLVIELFNLFLLNSVKVVPDCSFEEPAIFAKSRPIILSLWHGCLFANLYYLRNRNISVLVSLSRDGDFTTKILDSLGHRTIRGSSSRGGARVLLEAMKRLHSNSTVAFTVDGPKGPFREIKPGIIMLAQKTAIPIIPTGVAYEKYLTLNSWDRLQIPFPFTKAVLHIGSPLTITPGISVEEGCRMLKEKMNQCESIAKEKLKAGC